MTHLPEPRPYLRNHQSLVAASSIYTKEKVTRRQSPAEGWQEEAWDCYDEVGELRFVANAVANAVSKARLFAGRRSPNEITPVEEPDSVAAEVVSQLGGNRSAQTEILRSMALQLFVPGDGWLLGAPPGLLSGEPWDDEADWPLRDLDWIVLSVSEIEFRHEQIIVQRGDDQVGVDPDNAVLIRVWQPHPRKFWQADSPVRASLPVLRELIGLTKHVSASIDSRLAGAGMLVLPESATLMGDVGDDPDSDGSEAGTFMSTMMEAMLTPLKDRDVASSVVPLIVKVSDEVAAQVGQSSLIHFSTPFDAQAKELRDEGIRRLGLGLDVAPELLTGVGASVKYLNAWLVEESNTKLHVEPRLGLISSALTSQYLQPTLESLGESDVEEWVVWWDLTGLSSDLDRSEDAGRLHEAGLLGDRANRRESGFDEVDAPTAFDLAWRMVRDRPELLAEHGFLTVLSWMDEVVGERERYAEA